MKQKINTEVAEVAKFDYNIKKDKNKIKNPLYTVAFTVNEKYDKSPINDDSIVMDYLENHEAASSTTLKNEDSIEICKSILNCIIDERECAETSKTCNSVKVENLKQSIIPLPESLSNALKYIKEPLKIKHRVKSKPKKCTRLVKKKNMYFKNKRPEDMNKKLETYYDRTKSKGTNAGTIQRNLYSDSILNAVSRTRILKKILAKENLLDDIERNSLNEDRISYMSGSSDHTLTREKSVSSENSGFNNTKTTPSVIDVTNNCPIISESVEVSEIPKSIDYKDNTLISSNVNIETHKNKNPYCTNIISVAVAQIQNASILNYKKETTVTKSREKLRVKNSSTSDESYLSQSDIVTSTSSLDTLQNHGNERHIITVGISDSGVSSETLTGSQHVFDLTSESDKFVIAKTSSYFRNEDTDSVDTLIPNHDLNIKKESNAYQTKISSPKLFKSTFFDTLINVSMFPKETKSIQKSLFTSEYNDVIITDELRNPIKFNRQENESISENKYSKNVFKKSLNSDDDANRQKTISLPNEETIKEILFNRDKVQKKTCSEESRNFALFPELWDKLTLFLDTAMKRLEDSLIEKISLEMEKTLDRIDKFVQNTSRGDLKIPKSQIGFRKESHAISRMELGESKSLQCGSLQSHILDEIIKKINLNGLKIFKKPPLELKSKCKAISNDFFEVLKAPVEPCVSTEKGNGDSVVGTLSEGTGVQSSVNYSPLAFMTTIVRFVKVNLLVIASVPIFCSSLFLVYIFLSVLANV